MGPNLLCVLLRHKWTPAEATNEPGLQMVCQRCGRMRSFTGTTFAERANEDAGKPPLHTPGDPGPPSV
jgi:hypothetical protein